MPNDMGLLNEGKSCALRASMHCNMPDSWTESLSTRHTNSKLYAHGAAEQALNEAERGLQRLLHAANSAGERAPGGLWATRQATAKLTRRDLRAFETATVEAGVNAAALTFSHS